MFINFASNIVFQRTDKQSCNTFRNCFFCNNHSFSGFATKLVAKKCNISSCFRMLFSVRCLLFICHSKRIRIFRFTYTIHLDKSSLHCYCAARLQSIYNSAGMDYVFVVHILFKNTYKYFNRGDGMYSDRYLLYFWYPKRVHLDKSKFYFVTTIVFKLRHCYKPK